MAALVAGWVRGGGGGWGEGLALRGVWPFGFGGLGKPRWARWALSYAVGF